MSNKRSKVAIVFRGIGNIGGTNNTIADHARHLTALGHEVHLIGERLNKRGIDPAIGKAISVPKWPLGGRYKWRWFDGYADKKLRAGNYDFIAGHGHNQRQDVLSLHNCLRWAHELTHDATLAPKDPLLSLQETILEERNFRICIANSRLMRQDLINRYAVPKEQIKVIYPGYHPARFNTDDREKIRAEVRREHNLPDVFLIGLLTSGDYHKRGLDILIEAFSQLPTEIRSSSRLMLVGKAKHLNSYMQQAKEMGVAECILIVPPSRTPERYFKALDVCAHPARFEEFGQSVQEAMACGLPVVCNRRVGALELLPEAAQAKYPEAVQVDNIAEQIAAFYGSAPRREEYAAMGLQAVQDNSAERNFSRTLEVYREAGLPRV